MSPEQSQAIKSLQSVIWLNSLWRQDWIEVNIFPGEWATQCLELLTSNELRELESLSYQVAARSLPTGVFTNLRAHATRYFDISPRVFDYALIDFVRRQLCQTE